jgi:hypothetical protein
MCCVCVCVVFFDCSPCRVLCVGASLGVYGFYSSARYRGKRLTVSWRECVPYAPLVEIRRHAADVQTCGRLVWVYSPCLRIGTASIRSVSFALLLWSVRHPVPSRLPTCGNRRGGEVRGGLFGAAPWLWAWLGRGSLPGCAFGRGSEMRRWRASPGSLTTPLSMVDPEAGDAFDLDDTSPTSRTIAVSRSERLEAPHGGVVVQ